MTRKEIRFVVTSTYMLRVFHQFDRRLGELFRDEIAATGLPK